MKYCPDCSVRIRSEVAECPLCGITLEKDPVVSPDDSLAIPTATYEELTERVRRRPWIIGLVSMAVLILPAAISLIVDLLINRYLTWSVIVSGALALLWVYISMPALVFFIGRSVPEAGMDRRLARRRRFSMLMLINTLASWGYLLYLDRVDSDMALTWAPVAGGLLTSLTFFLVLVCFLTLDHNGAVRRGSLLFFWFSVYVIGLDLVISQLIPGAGNFGWSLIVSSSLVPLGLIYALFEYLVTHNTKARRRLHV